MVNKENMTPALTREQCLMLRGFAILSIVLHIIAHTFAFAVKENEYTFSLGRTRLLSEYIHDLPLSSPIQLLSFFGHYGVPIFVFLSGFGLVMKYEKSGLRVSASAFLGYNYLKLFRLLVVGYVLYLILSPVDLSGKSTAFMLTMSINIIPDIEIVPGPYWFFGLMLQLYIFYRMIIYNASGEGKRQWIVPVCVIVVAYLSQAFLSPSSSVLSKMRYNLFSGLMPFATGVLVARFCTFRTLSTMTLSIAVIVSVILVWICNFNFQAWLWSWVPVVVGSVAFVSLVSRAGKVMILKTVESRHKCNTRQS